MPADKAELKTLVRDVLRSCRGKGKRPLLVADLLALPFNEAYLGSPLTFITFREWCGLPWPRAAGEGCGVDREADVLFGAWLSWRSQYVLAAAYLNAECGGFSVRRLSGRKADGVLVESRTSPFPCGRPLYVSYSFLDDPFMPDSPACIACALHDRNGVFYAWAVAWNTESKKNTVDAATAYLRKWAEGVCSDVAGVYWVYDDPESKTSMPLCPDPLSESGILIPIADLEGAGPARVQPKERSRPGVVIPFPKKEASVCSTKTSEPER